MVRNVIAVASLVGAALLAGPLGATEYTKLAPAGWSHKESPMLQEMVKAGKLPPVSERLPKQPKVVPVEKEFGRYGGTLFRGTAFLRSEWIPLHMTMEPFTEVHWPLPSDGPIHTNVARDWTFSTDGMSMVLHLREGMKWSDGQPFTADDVMFYWYDVLFEEKSAAKPKSTLYVRGKEAPKLDKVDDYTLKLTFPEPFFFAETAMATIEEVAWPKHVMKQYHPKYNSSATWETWNENLSYLKGRGKVTLAAWRLEEYIPGEKFVLVRNPYYWKVDERGNQLPYIDRVEVREVEDRQSVALGNVSGQFDSDGMWVGSQHLQLFLEEQPKRKYDVGFGKVPGMAMFFNYDAKDPTVRAALRDVNFRRAFSLAINRGEINRVLFADKLTPSGFTFSSSSPYVTANDFALWSQDDSDQAKKLLDAGGFKDTNGDGIREAPDGKALSLTVDVSQHDLYVPLNEMVVDYLAEVGIKLVMNVQHQNLIEERRTGDEWQIHAWDLNGVDEPLANLTLWVPVSDNTPFWHQKASKAPFSKEYAAYSKILLEARSLPYDKRVESMKKANNLMSDNVFGIHIGYYDRPFIKSHRIVNIPDGYARIGEFGSNQPAFRYLQSFLRWDKP